MRRERIINGELKRGFISWILLEKDMHVEVLEMMQTEIDKINPAKFINIEDIYYDMSPFTNDNSSLVITKFVKKENDYIQKDLCKLEDKALIPLLHNKYFKDKKIKLIHNETTVPNDEDKDVSRKKSWLIMYRADKDVYISTSPIKDLKDSYTTNIWEYSKNIHYYFIVIDTEESVMVSIRKMYVEDDNVRLIDIDELEDGHVLDTVYEHVYGSLLKS